MIQPQCKDLIDTLMKLVKIKNDFKVQIYETLTKVIKSGHVMQQSDAILKFLLKNPEIEFQSEWADSISALIQDYPSNFIQWGQIWPELLIAGIRESEICSSHKIMYQIVRVRLIESKQQGNILTNIKEYIPTKAIDKKVKQVDFGRTLSEIFQYFTSIIEKIQSSTVSDAQKKVCSGLASCLSQLIIDFPEHLEAINFETFLSTLIGQWVKKSDSQIFVNQVLSTVITTMKDTEYLQNILLLIFDLLKTQKLKQKPISVTQRQVCINSANQILKCFETNKLTDLIEYNTLIDTILPLIQQQEQLQDLIITIGQSTPIWLHQMISTFLSQVQIAAADIQSSPPAFVYTANKTNLVLVQVLNELAEIYKSLMQIFIDRIGGEPVTLSNTGFFAAQNYILGPKNKQNVNFQQIKLVDINRREHGWTILEGLLQLGQQWIDSNFTNIFLLFESAFSKPMCQLDFEELNKNVQHQEVYVQEFKTKVRALKACRVLLKNNLSRKAHQQLGKLLTQAIEFFMPKQVNKITETLISADEIINANTILFDCFAQIPCQYYQSKLVSLVHSLCELLVSLKESHLPIEFLDPIDQSLSKAQEQDTRMYPHNLKTIMGLFVKIFTNQNALTQANKDQLIQHFLAHTGPSVKKTKQPSGETTIQVLPYRPDKIAKMQRIGITLLLSMRGVDNLDHYQNQLKEICTNLMKCCDPTLVRISTELLIEIYAKDILQFGPQALLDQIEEALSKNLKLNINQELMMAAAICGNIIRNFDERIGVPIDRITNIFLKLFKSQNSDVIKFATHFAYQISLEYEVFRSQLLPAVFICFYGTTNELVNTFASISIIDKSNHAQIMVQDNIQSIQRSLVKHGQIQDLAFEQLSDYQIVSELLKQGQIDRLQAKCNKGFFMHFIVDQIQNNTPNTEWKLIYKSYICQISIKESIEFVKQCLQQQHLSPLTLMNQQQKNIFKEKLSSKTISYLIDELNWIITEHQQPYKLILDVMHLSLSVVSHQSKDVELAGILLLTKSIKFLQKIVEIVGDQDDELSPRSRERQNFIKNPLLIEQFEAQIFSVIRQKLQAKGSDLSYLTVQATLDLVDQFITLPITHDQSIIKKILSMLITTDMEKLNLLLCELYTHEGLITETHILKLHLISKLLIKGYQPIEKKVLSKFEEEDRIQLKSSFDNKMVQVIIQNFKTVLADCLGQSKTFLQGGTYSKEKIEASLPEIITALNYITSAESSLVYDSIYRGLTAPFQDDLYKFYQQKVVYLQLAQQSYRTLSIDLISPVLQHLTQLGISEINENVLKVYILLQDQRLILNSQLTPEQIMYNTLSILMQAEPEFSGSLSQANLQLIDLCLQSLTSSAKLVCTDYKNLTSFLMVQVVSRLCTFISRQQSNENIGIYLQTFNKILTYIKPSINEETKQITISILNDLVQNQEQIDLVVNLLEISDETAPIVSQIKSNCLGLLLQRDQIQMSSQIIKNFIVKQFDQDPDVETLQFLLKFYKDGITTEDRQKFLTPYLALLFQTIQLKNDARQVAAEHLFEIFTYDVNAIKGFATSVDSKGNLLLAGAEKTLAENIIRNYSALQQQQTAQLQMQNQVKTVESTGIRKKLELKKLSK